VVVSKKLIRNEYASLTHCIHHRIDIYICVLPLGR